LTLAASALPQLKKHVSLDERSAAFLALGIGKAQNKPAALICTSGTAVANYLPAVIEATKSGIPMLLLTADRPERLHGTGANQTINQKKIYVDFTVLFESMNEPFEQFDEEGLKQRAQNYFFHAVSRQGPVHINFPFDKPLEPAGNIFKKIMDENKNAERHNTSAKKHIPFSFDSSLLKTIQESIRPLFIVGQLTPAVNLASIFKLAARLNAPVLSEQGDSDSNLSVQHFEGFL